MNCVRFSPDGNRFATASADGQVKKKKKQLLVLIKIRSFLSILEIGLVLELSCSYLFYSEK